MQNHPQMYRKDLDSLLSLTCALRANENGWKVTVGLMFSITIRKLTASFASLEEFHIGLLLCYKFLIKLLLNKTQKPLWLIALDVNRTVFSWLSRHFWDRISCNVDQALCHIKNLSMQDLCLFSWLTLCSFWCMFVYLLRSVSYNQFTFL